MNHNFQSNVFLAEKLFSFNGKPQNLYGINNNIANPYRQSEKHRVKNVISSTVKSKHTNQNLEHTKNIISLKIKPIDIFEYSKDTKKIIQGLPRNIKRDLKEKLTAKKNSSGIYESKTYFGVNLENSKIKGINRNNLKIENQNFH